MKSLTIQIDDIVYEHLQSLGLYDENALTTLVNRLLKNTSKLDFTIDRQENKGSLILDSADEQHIKKIISNNEWITSGEFDKEFGFPPK